MFSNETNAQLINFLGNGFPKGNKFNSIISDDSSIYFAVANTKSRAIFIKTSADKVVDLANYNLLTTGAVTAKFYKDVYLPVINHATITVSEIPTSTGILTLTINGTEYEVSVTEGDTLANVATAISTVVDALTDFTSTANNAVATIAYASTNYVPMEVSIDVADTGVIATIEVLETTTAIAKQDVFNKNHLSDTEAETEIFTSPDSVDFSNCLKEDTKIIDIVQLNKTTPDSKITLLKNSNYALLISNATGGAVNIVPKIEFIEK